MTDSIQQHEHEWHTQLIAPHRSVTLSEAFLDTLIAEWNDDNVTALVLIGSYARGDATVYSDVDLIRFVYSVPQGKHHTQYLYRDGYLLNLSTRTIAQYRERFTRPEEAFFVVPTIRKARILLDKEGSFLQLQQEAQAWTWEPLQAAANAYASEIMMAQTESVHKILRALSLS